LGCGIEITNKSEAYRVFRELLSNDEKRNKLGEISRNYVENNIGATEKIIYEFSRLNKKR
ncbi:MAG: hypothetical protein KDC88_11565, partial [Ignavibacteriae bacterium]|nr:hypothetical protein [Ignavibacteriota bacterium]